MTILHNTPAAHHRFHLLDALRGVAALMVVLWHAPPSLFDHNRHPVYLAVDFFFCLSGFVIAFSYEKRLATSLSFREFLVARLIRLYPLYLLGTVFGLIAQVTGTMLLPVRLKHSLSTVPLFLTQALMLPNLKVGHFKAWDSTRLFPLNPPAWSLFFELAANLAFALLLCRPWLRKRLARSGSLVAIAAASLVAVLLWNAKVARELDLGWSTGLIDAALGMARVAFSFSIGVLLLRIYRRRPLLTPGVLAQWCLPVLTTALLVVALVTPFAALRSFAFHAVTIAVVFPAIVFLGALARISAWLTPLCVFLGDISYPLYLLHVEFDYQLFRPWASDRIAHSPAFATLALPLTVIITVAVAYLAAHFYDRPVRRFLTRAFNTRTLIDGGTIHA